MKIKLIPLLLMAATITTSCSGSNELARRKYKYESGSISYNTIGKEEFYEKNGFFKDEAEVLNYFKTRLTSSGSEEHPMPDSTLTFSDQIGPTSQVKFNDKSADFWHVNYQETSESHVASLCYYSKVEGDWHFYNIDTETIQLKRAKLFEINHIGFSTTKQAVASETSMKFEDKKLTLTFDFKIVNWNMTTYEKSDLYKNVVTTVWILQ